jgi:hypothetical protein
LGFEIFILKIIIFILFVVMVIWLLTLLLRQDSEPEAGLEIYTVRDDRVLIYKLRDWKEVQGNAD